MPLQKTLNEFAVTNHMLGGKETELTDAQVKKLNDDLIALSQKNRVYFKMCLGMVVALFIVSIFIVFNFFNDPKQLKLIFGGTGISVMGLIAYANKLWKDIVRTDMTITLMTAMDKKGINTMLLVLIRKL